MPLKGVSQVLFLIFRDIKMFLYLNKVKHVFILKTNETHTHPYLLSISSLNNVCFLLSPKEILNSFSLFFSFPKNSFFITYYALSLIFHYFVGETDMATDCSNTIWQQFQYSMKNHGNRNKVIDSELLQKRDCVYLVPVMFLH